MLLLCTSEDLLTHRASRAAGSAGALSIPLYTRAAAEEAVEHQA